jgi:hypothetical protein
MKFKEKYFPVLAYLALGIPIYSVTYLVFYSDTKSLFWFLMVIGFIPVILLQIKWNQNKL